MEEVKEEISKDLQKESEKFVALKYRDFRLLWIASLISNIGSQMQIVALNWHIFVLTNSAFALGLIGLFRVLPIVLFSLLGGNFADVYNRKKILFTTQLLLTGLSFILAFTTLKGHVTPFILYAITTVSTIVMAFDMPARQALVPNLLKREHLANAMSLNVIMFQTTLITGSALAGIAIAGLGVGNVYLLNAVSFIAVLIALIMMRTSGQTHGEKTELSFAAVWEGLVFVRSKTIIWSTMLLDFFSTFFASATVLLPLYARDILQVGPLGMGLLYAAPAVGALISGIVMAHIKKIKHQGKLLLWGVCIYAISTILFGISKIFWASFAVLIVLGAGDAISTIIRNTIRQLATSDNLRGRMTSVNMIFFMGGPQLGEFEAGVLAALVGAPLSVVIGGITTILVVIGMAAKIPILRTYQNHENQY